MRVSSLNFHFDKAPVFTARQYGATRWIEVRDVDAKHDTFAIFTGGDRSFEQLTIIAAALTAAWSESEPADAIPWAR